MISSVITVKLKKLLEERGKSIFQLHKETDITYPTLHKIASGKGEGISFKVLEKLCENLGCFPSDLLLFERNTTTQTVKPQAVKVEDNPTQKTAQGSADEPTEREKPASTSETLKKPVTARTISKVAEGMLTLQQVADTLGIKRKSVNDYVGKQLKTSQPSGPGTAHYISETDYLDFEAWYKENILKQK
jgi:putative transcriptional regulator